jgi:hypothetical protein
LVGTAGIADAPTHLFICKRSPKGAGAGVQASVVIYVWGERARSS